MSVDSRFKTSNAGWKSLAINQGQNIARFHGCLMNHVESGNFDDTVP